MKRGVLTSMTGNIGIALEIVQMASSSVDLSSVQLLSRRLLNLKRGSTCLNCCACKTGWQPKLMVAMKVLDSIVQSMQRLVFEK